MGVCSSTRDRYIGGRASVIVVADGKQGEDLMRVEDEERERVSSVITPVSHAYLSLQL